jgi:iron(III) transport system ATP-binding protein
MEAGHIRQWDTAYRLYHQPLSRFVADFVGQGVIVPGRMVSERAVAFELGTLQTGAHAAGSAVDILLRPDDIAHDDSSSVRAELVHKAFRGAQFLYTLRLASGLQVLSLVPSHHDHAIGERVGIRLQANHLVTFRAQH